MIRRIFTRQIAQLLVMLACAWSMKWFYFNGDCGSVALDTVADYEAG